MMPDTVPTGESTVEGTPAPWLEGAKTVKNRLRFDLGVDDIGATTERIERLGGKHLR